MTKLNSKKSIEQLIQEYCEEHFCYIVDNDVWEDAEKALEVFNDLIESYQRLINEIDSNKLDPGIATKQIDEWCIEKMRGIICDYFGEKILKDSRNDEGMANG